MPVGQSNPSFGNGQFPFISNPEAPVIVDHEWDFLNGEDLSQWIDERDNGAGGEVYSAVDLPLTDP